MLIAFGAEEVEFLTAIGQLKDNPYYQEPLTERLGEMDFFFAGRGEPTLGQAGAALKSTTRMI